MIEKNITMRFQDKIRKFIVDTFGVLLADDTQERCHRFAEESIELLQACGYTKEQMYIMLDYVYEREPGKRQQEVGGVMTTLAGLCSAYNIDMIKQAGREATRAFKMADKIKVKHSNKPSCIKTNIYEIN